MPARLSRRASRGFTLIELLVAMAALGILAAIERIQDKLMATGAREVPSTRVGELVMRELKRLDKVAYVRFASVYRSFEDVDEFSRLIKDI